MHRQAHVYIFMRMYARMYVDVCMHICMYLYSFNRPRSMVHTNPSFWSLTWADCSSFIRARSLSKYTCMINLHWMHTERIHSSVCDENAHMFTLWQKKNVDPYTYRYKYTHKQTHFAGNTYESPERRVRMALLLPAPHGHTQEQLQHIRAATNSWWLDVWAL